MRSIVSHRKYAPRDTELESVREHRTGGQARSLGCSLAYPPVSLSLQRLVIVNAAFAICRYRTGCEQGLLNRMNQQHLSLIAHLRHNAIPLANGSGHPGVLVEMQLYYVASIFPDQIVTAFNA
jgi:hypothetical protein